MNSSASLDEVRQIGSISVSVSLSRDATLLLFKQYGTFLRDGDMTYISVLQNERWRGPKWLLMFQAMCNYPQLTQPSLKIT